MPKAVGGAIGGASAQAVPTPVKSLPQFLNACSLTPGDPEVNKLTNPYPALHAPKRQAAPRFAPALPLSVVAVPRPKSPTFSEPAALSKSTDLRLTHPASTCPSR